MDKTQAAKLAQAYQWLSEGKEVQYLPWSGVWKSWKGHGTALEYRLKPKPEPLLECWANEYPDGKMSCYLTISDAKKWARPDCIRVAVPMHEDREPDIEGMTRRLRETATWLVFDDKYAERIVRHIIGDAT